MLREKRHTKPPTSYEIPLICYPRKRNKKLEKCKFESIPLPLKFAYVGGVFHFYGGISLQKSYGKLKTQSALLSECFKCEEVKVTKLNEQKIVNMRFMKLPVFHYPPWQPMVEKLSSSKKPEVCQWANVIKYYCLNYEDKLRAWSNLDAYRNQYCEEKLIEMNKNSEKRIVDYCERYPCIVFRAQLSEGQMQFSDIIVNEKYLEHAGYTVDNFAVTILRDGLPQLLPGNNINAVRVFLDNYRSIEKCDFQTPELTSDLLTRKGYTRKVSYKAHYSATYRDGVPGMDCVWVITNNEPMALAIKSTADRRLNKGYLEEAIKKEQQADEFLQRYYNTSSNGEYANLSKVCKIKELGNEQTEKDGRSC